VAENFKFLFSPHILTQKYKFVEQNHSVHITYGIVLLLTPGGGISQADDRIGLVCIFASQIITNYNDAVAAARVI